MDLQLALSREKRFFMLTLRDLMRKRPPGELIFPGAATKRWTRKKWKINFPLRGKRRKATKQEKTRKIMRFFTCLALPIFFQIVFTSRL
jgi:hypothetical protein